MVSIEAECRMAVGGVMYPDNHPVELAWRRFRNGPRYDLLHQALQVRPAYLNSIGLHTLPSRVILPGAIPWNLLASQEARARGEEIGRTLSTDSTILATSAACWAAYREAKTVYEIDEWLAESLGRTPWPERVPTEALELPSRCPVLVLPWEGERVCVAAYYDLLTARESTGLIELRLATLAGDQWMPNSILHVNKRDLGACVLSAGLEVVARSGQVDQADSFRHPLSGLALTVLLYLAGEADIVTQVHPGAKPERDQRLRRRDPDRWKDLRSPTVYGVGGAFRAAIERWEIEQACEAGGSAGRTVRPHMRRAHPHVYWTGPGRHVPRVRFLLPIPVKGAPVVEEQETPAIRPVR